ncbi:unnamed protein product [Rotaria magnacalcarata]
MCKSPNEMDDCPFALSLATPLVTSYEYTFAKKDNAALIRIKSTCVYTYLCSAHIIIDICASIQLRDVKSLCTLRTCLGLFSIPCP